MNKIIDKVIKIIRDKYPEIYIDYDYLEDSNTYEIWFNKIELREDLKFQSFIGRLIKEYLHPNSIYNFYIDYNEEKSNLLAKNEEVNDLIEKEKKEKEKD
jgi:hypothetical protein